MQTPVISRMHCANGCLLVVLQAKFLKLQSALLMLHAWQNVCEEQLESIGNQPPWAAVAIARMLLQRSSCQCTKL